jgi:hypothetical protein
MERLTERLKQLVARDASDARISPHLIRGIILAPPLVAVGVLLLFFVSRRFFLWLLAEWRPIELLQVMFYGLAALLALRVALHLWRGQQRAIAALYLAAGLGLLFISGEEMSWGQPIFRRIFRWWPDRDTLRAINVQGETTIHNLRSLRGVFNWLYFAIALYGLFSPLLFLMERFRHDSRLRLLALPVITVPGFMFAAAFMFVRLFVAPYVGLLESQSFMRYKEVTELALAFGLCVFSWMSWRWLTLPSEVRATAPADSGEMHLNPASQASD